MNWRPLRPLSPEHAARRTELLAQWAAEWAAAKIDVGLPDVMRLWVDQLAAVKSRAERLEKLASAVKKLGESIEKHKGILRAALGRSDADSRERSTSFTRSSSGTSTPIASRVRRA